MLPFWSDTICKAILEGKSVIIVAHGNSIRSIVKYLDNMSEEGKIKILKWDIMELNIPTGTPLVYEFDENLNPIKHYYLADEKEL